MLRRALLFESDAGYWPQARLAIESARRWNPSYDIHVVTDGTYDSGFTNHNGRDFDTAHGWLGACKPGVMLRLLTTSGYDEVLFIDSDTYTYGPYLEAQAELGSGASILVTPHVTSPLPIEHGSPSLMQIARMGNYNSGFIGATPAAIPFLEFVYEWTLHYPMLDDRNFIASEQGWLRFACDFDERARVFRHPGYNWAYWNATQRPLSRSESGELLASGAPLRMAHFSGLTPDLNPNKMSRHQNRVRLDAGSLELELFTEYQSQLTALRPL